MVGIGFNPDDIFRDSAIGQQSPEDNDSVFCVAIPSFEHHAFMDTPGIACGGPNGSNLDPEGCRDAPIAFLGDKACVHTPGSTAFLWLWDDIDVRRFSYRGRFLDFFKVEFARQRNIEFIDPLGFFYRVDRLPIVGKPT